MSKIRVEIDAVQASQLVKLNTARIAELTTTIKTLTKQNETLTQAMTESLFKDGKGIQIDTSYLNLTPATSYSWRTEIRSYFSDHTIDAGARIIEGFIAFQHNITEAKERQHIRNQLSIALSSMAGKGELVKKGKNDMGEILYNKK